MLDRGAIMGNLGLGIDGGVPRTTTRQGLREVPKGSRESREPGNASQSRAYAAGPAASRP
jgi:hypothetical protein